MFLPVTLQLLEGFWETLKVFAMTLVFSLPLGLVICFGSMSKWAPLEFLSRSKNSFFENFKPIRWLCRGLVWIIRGTPLMLQLIVIFYGPGLMFDLPLLPRFTATIVAFSLNYACYFSEIYRGGIESIAKGQYEAGQVLGMTKSQIFFKVVLLQVVKRIMAPMSNEIITLVKDTSLARIIALQEIIWAGQAFMKGSHGIAGQIWPLFFTAVYYLLFNGLLTVLLTKLEKKLDYFQA